MGTHPIFESDFDCLTDSVTFEFENGKIREKSYDFGSTLGSNG